MPHLDDSLAHLIHAREAVDALREAIAALVDRCPDAPYEVRQGETVTDWRTYAEGIVDSALFGGARQRESAELRVSALYAAAVGDPPPEPFPDLSGHVAAGDGPSQQPPETTPAAQGRHGASELGGLFASAVDAPTTD